MVVVSHHFFAVSHHFCFFMTIILNFIRFLKKNKKK